MPANIVELPFPHNDPNTKDARAFRIEDGSLDIGVCYSRKPILPGGGYRVHISISKTKPQQIYKVNKLDIDVVMKTLVTLGLLPPANWRLEFFAEGPFAGKGCHIFEIAP